MSEVYWNTLRLACLCRFVIVLRGRDILSYIQRIYTPTRITGLYTVPVTYVHWRQVFGYFVLTEVTSWEQETAGHTSGSSGFLWEPRNGGGLHNVHIYSVCLSSSPSSTDGLCYSIAALYIHCRRGPHLPNLENKTEGACMYNIHSERALWSVIVYTRVLQFMRWLYIVIALFFS